ncbi:MAG: GAF domain-containing protein [Cyanobacteria bacterium J06621_8]
MLQGEHSQLIQDLSWEKIGQAIVDAVVHIEDIDIAILYLDQFPLIQQQYFWQQKSSAENKLIEDDLLKSTIIQDAQAWVNHDPEYLMINWQDAATLEQQFPNYQACAAAKITSTVVVSLFNQVNLTASLTIHSLQPDKCWQPPEIARIEMMATQANLMLSQMLAREKLLELAHRETTINSITATIRASLEPPVMFAAIAKELGEALRVDGCTLSLWTKSDRFVRCVGLYNPHEPQQIMQNSVGKSAPEAHVDRTESSESQGRFVPERDWRITNESLGFPPDNAPPNHFGSRGDSSQKQATTSNVPISENPILQALLFTKKTINLADLEQQQQLARYELPWHARARALMIVPLLRESEIIGSITLRQSQACRNWTQSEIELAEAVADQAAIAIEQVLAHQQVKELANRETTINQITATIRSSLEPPVMFAAIAKELGKALRVDGCTLSLWTRSDRFVQCVGLYNPHEPQQIMQRPQDWQQATTSRVSIAENPLLQALLFTKKTINLADLEQQQLLARYELPWHSRARALMIVPLLVESEIIGSITLRQTQACRNWTKSEIELAEAVADQAAIAVQQAKLYQKLLIEKQKVRQLNNYLTESVLKRFLPAKIVNKAAKGELSLYLTPEPRRITVLFCDLANFTNLSSQINEFVLAEILNEYLEAMTAAVFERGGTVDKFTGDGLMAMFGAPEDLSCPEQAARAIETARIMYLHLDKLNQRWQEQSSLRNLKIPMLKMRCGIHQGKAVVGMFGGKQRKDYTAVGKVVNIAARLENAAPPNSILISEAVANCLQQSVDWGQGHNLKLKGIKQDFRAFSIKVKPSST